MTTCWTKAAGAIDFAALDAAELERREEGGWVWMVYGWGEWGAFLDRGTFRHARDTEELGACHQDPVEIYGTCDERQ